MEPLIVSAKTLEDAITKACVDLGVTSEMISYEIKDNGSNGIFGIGARPCIISVTKKSDAEEKLSEHAFAAEKPVKDHSVRAERKTAESKSERKEQPAETQKTERRERPSEAQKAERRDRPSEAQKAERRERPSEALKAESRAADKVRKNSAEKHEEPGQPEIIKRPEIINQGPKVRTEQAAVPAKDGNRKEHAEAFLKSVFEAMKMDVKINVSQETEEEISIVLTGEDMGVLIGKRGQTLDALQYLTGQVINKHYNDYVRVKIDTENYRERRKETLETLAVNIAGKVRRTRKPVALEPMNPYERRLIHSILQEEKDIFTRSEGEEPYRHVVIYCTRKKK